MQRIFTRDVAGLKAGQILPETDQYMDWDAFEQSARLHHDVTDALETYSLPVEEAARRYVTLLGEGKAPPRRRS